MNTNLDITLDIVKEYYKRFNAKNFSGMLEIVADDIRHEPNQGDPRIGKELFGQFMEKMDQAYEETLTDMVFFVSEDGTRIAAEFTVNGKYKVAEEGLPEAHGQSYILPAAAFLEVKAGKVSRVTTYYNLELWIKLVS